MWFILPKDYNSGVSYYFLFNATRFPLCAYLAHPTHWLLAGSVVSSAKAGIQVLAHS